MDRNSKNCIELILLPCRSLRGNVDRNSALPVPMSSGLCRSLRGNVDRNIDAGGDEFLNNAVVPYVGTWIEIH